ELLSEYRATAGRSSALPGQVTYSLVEAVIHGEDIARPTGKRLDAAPRSLVTVAEIARRTDPILGGKRRSAGLTLRATDLAWSAGAGPGVMGPLASIILAITGRPAGLDDLAGEGLDTLRSRLCPLLGPRRHVTPAEPHPIPHTAPPTELKFLDCWLHPTSRVSPSMGGYIFRN